MKNYAQLSTTCSFRVLLPHCRLTHYLQKKKLLLLRHTIPIRKIAVRETQFSVSKPQKPQLVLHLLLFLRFLLPLNQLWRLLFRCQCYGSGSCRIRIILPDPNRYQSKKHMYVFGFFPISFNAVQNT
jgi:hypothetical protein